MSSKPAAPAATYRIQFNQSFRLIDARELVPYLSQLGISDLYSSPRYMARRASSHGYDIANPLRINSEIGTEEDFDEMTEKLRHYGMGLLLDTVPNHMAASYENAWWMDVLENGQSSAFASYFDIDWSRHEASGGGWNGAARIVLPVLGDLFGNVLNAGEFTLRFEDTGMYVQYYEKRMPLDPKTYLAILERCPEMPELLEVQHGLEALPDRDESSVERVMGRRREKERLKSMLWTAYLNSAPVKQAMDEALRLFMRSPDDLERLLGMQAYRLAYWKVGYEDINYRRFFDINELVGLRIELPEVFEVRNQKTMELIRAGKVTGLRIDHIDGLWDPGCFLQRLQSRANDNSGFYVVVEKILGRNEALPHEWPVSGTTGYDFLNALNGIFVAPAGLATLEEVYARKTGKNVPFADVCYESSKLVMETIFLGDVNALGVRLRVLAGEHRHARDLRFSELRELLVEVTACLPVYRTYIHDFEISARDREYIENTLQQARRRTSRDRISDAAFDFFRSVLLLEPPEYLASKRKEWLNFVMRWQQFSGPVMAKGLEDTATYRHNSLLSLNEVGGDPARERPPANLEEFHEFNRRRLEESPDTLNATATHDTKRGEDARARLNVLSELPDEWAERLERWMEWNRAAKSQVQGVEAPSVSEEMLIYQTLLAIWPNDQAEPESVLGRVKEFVVKALREAKENSSWISPQEPYEQAVQDFVDRIFALETEFAADFEKFQKMIALPGARNGLTQLLLKIGSPGVPDFYQGTELWQYALVDPDNRLPVNYARRQELLDRLRLRESEDRIALIRELSGDLLRDEIKLFVTYKALEFRKAERELFARGEYLPLQARGVRAKHVCAFARRLGERWAVVAAPRFTVSLGAWEDTEIVMPQGSPAEWQDVLTGLIPAGWRMADVLAEFPVALLCNRTGDGR